MSDQESKPVRIPKAVFDGLHQCQEQGGQDMRQVRAVLRWLRDNGWYTAADWVEKNEQIYLNSVIQPGFTPEA